MKPDKNLEVSKKQEVENKAEHTLPGKFYIPLTDIYETKDNLTLVMDMPGVLKEHVIINLLNNNLEITGKISSDIYEGLRPVHTEYNVGHFARSFVLSNKIDQGHIEANMNDGVLTLTLPKTKEPEPRRIQIK